MATGATSEQYPTNTGDTMQTTPKRRWLFLVGRIPARRTPTGRVLALVPSSAPAAAPKEAA